MKKKEIKYGISNLNLLKEKHKLDILLSKDNKKNNNNDYSSSDLDIDSSDNLNKRIKNTSDRSENINDYSINNNKI